MKMSTIAKLSRCNVTERNRHAFYGYAVTRSTLWNRIISKQQRPTHGPARVEKTILTSAKVNVTRLPSHVCRCHVLVLSRTAVVLLGDYVVVLISGLYIAFGEELRWLKKSSVLFSRNLIFVFIAYWHWCLKKQTCMFTIIVRSLCVIQTNK